MSGNQMHCKRNSNVELIRILSMLIIVIYHYEAREFGLYVVGNDRIGEDSLLPSLIMHSIGKLGVPIFVFISGYYGIKFKTERFWELIATTAFYTVLSVAILFFVYGITTVKPMIAFINNWWFIAAYICLYILSGGVNHVVENTPKWPMLAFIIVFYYISFGNLFVDSANIGGLYTMFTMYLFARWIRLHIIDFIKQYSWFTFLVLLTIRIAIICAGYYGHHLGILPYINSYVNPLTMLIAAALFCVFENLPQVINIKHINVFAASALSVYLFSEGPCGQKLFAPLFPTKGNWDLLHYIIGSVITYLVILCIDRFRMIVTEYFITNKFKKIS